MLTYKIVVGNISPKAKTIVNISCISGICSIVALSCTLNLVDLVTIC